MTLLSRLLAIGGLALMPMVTHAAAPVTDQRDTTYVMHFSGMTFANAFNDRADLLSLHGSIGDSATYAVTGFSPGDAISVVSGSGIAISNLQPADATGNAHYTASIIGTTGLTINQSWVNVSTLSTGVSADGLDYLDFFSHNAGFLKAGGVFDFLVSIPGDWSTFGTASGDVQFFGINPDFSITQNFVFDSTSGMTTFEAINNDYRLDNASTEMHFRLYGQAVAAVPEPSALSLVALGLAGLVGMRRFRKRS